MNQIPDEILLQVFCYLDNKNIITSTRVCKRWLNLINTSSCIVKRFDLSVVLRSDTFKTFTSLKNANHRNLFITGVNSELFDLEATKFPDELKHTIARYQSDIQEVTCMSIKCSMLDQINVFRNTSKLILFGIKKDFCENLKINLPRLKVLEIYFSIFCLNFLNSHNLRVLRVFGNNEEINGIQDEFQIILDKFLENCENLKELKISTNSQTFKFNVKLQLENLFLERIKIDDENFLNFLKSQKFLENLSLVELNEIPKSIELILSQMRIKSLEIGVQLIPNNFKSLNVNIFIEKLTIRHLDQKDFTSRHSSAHFHQPGQFNPLPNVNLTFDNFKKTEKLFLICKNVKVLRIYEWMGQTDLFVPIHMNLLKLETLKISTISSVIPAIVKLNSLKFIEIDKVESENQLQSLSCLINNCSKLIKVKINQAEKCLEILNFLKTIKGAKNLQEIHFGALIKFNDKMIEILTESQFKVLSLKSENENSIESKVSLIYRNTNFFKLSTEETEYGAMNNFKTKNYLKYKKLHEKLIHHKFSTEFSISKFR